MKVILIMVQSINGKVRLIINKNQPWSSQEDKKHFSKVTKEIGVVIMGRKTFEEIGKPLDKRKNIVLTGEPEKYQKLEKTYQGSLFFTDEKPESLLNRLEKEGYQTVALIGGPTINALFLEKNLIDEIYLTIEPVIIEGDLSLFSYVQGTYQFKLNEVINLNNDAILLKYQKQQGR
ncbi:MAG: dihydrofolate reductase family protein [Defluviitoga tunisiensis]|jgi:dihydrofolate reductase|uniref:Dihydrofolate reductase n=1 Tax=Defluviitoga tunisiensis TaxID=1006576 RepID=A0A0C7NJR8_DEFTU|nr:dihydrofolate reductase family protein [Defluviitoga tunisiensis]CEP78201.1 dihydrofolate reductase [Defluviitoga tunisiensis]